ncbi:MULTISPECIES: hypothetical protein [Streptomyces]|uniref:hypothetical protein n=1 Tax=Streptomyces TaxID=1883 RepID=UPI00378D2F6B
MSEGAESFEAAELQLSMVMCSPSAPAHWREIRSRPAEWPWCGKARLEVLKAAARSRKSVAAVCKNFCRSPWGLEHPVFPTELIVGELVTNAARSGGAALQWACG